MTTGAKATICTKKKTHKNLCCIDIYNNRVGFLCVFKSVWLWLHLIVCVHVPASGWDCVTAVQPFYNPGWSRTDSQLPLLLILHDTHMHTHTLSLWFLDMCVVQTDRDHMVVATAELGLPNSFIWCHLLYKQEKPVCGYKGKTHTKWFESGFIYL